ncbi:hypothetical protein CR513_37737, partial [Mucuna pruriens]
MTRSSSDLLYELDPEIEITLRRLRKSRNIVVSNSSNSVSSSDISSLVTNTSDSVEYSSTNNFVEQMENNNERTLKELATPDVLYQPWCIQYPHLEPAQTYELKYGLIHLLSKFHGLAGEDPHNEATRDTEGLHQNEGVPILPGWSSKRLDFFPASKTVTIRKEICGISLESEEPSQPRMVNEIGVVDNLRLKNQLIELIALVRQLAVGQHQPNIAAKFCGICTFVEHPTDMCPTLQETESDQPENVEAICGYQYGKQTYQSQPFDN